MGNAVRVSGLTKTYRLYESSIDRALDVFRRTDRSRKFTALNNINLDFPAGEVVAILGKNGSGKSTLLKIITGVASQTTGEVEVNGRVSAMLELTSGFDKELSGEENIYLRALAMGIPRDEVEAKKQEIIDFADIGTHINQPVRTYSSGMKARLGFAVSVSVDPDILIVDEVLAVGDDVFKLKCIDKMQHFRKEGKTILFVSHSLFTVKAFCTRGVWLDKGVVMAEGDLGDVITKYEDFLREERRRAKAVAPKDEAPPMDKSDVVKIAGFRMLNQAGEKTTNFKYGEDVLFEFRYEVKRPVEKLTFCFTVRNAEYHEVFMADKQNPDNTIASNVGKHTLRVRLRSPNLLAGTYALSGELWNNEAAFYVGYSNKRPFTIEQDEFIGTGITRIDYEFEND
ncbi:MAG: ABC transporter ATP-binding protein [Coriobacteriia bacterium]|nr:ABC transporter ATP-binding protein [Coriobacteriia bacterium]MBN2822843.1 ABC transporter ATP-binding protein [Coriobacteriia bacterium]